MEVALMAAFCEGIARPARFADGLRHAAEYLGCSEASVRIWDRRARWGGAWSARKGASAWACEAGDGVLPAPALRSTVKRMEPGRWYRQEHTQPAWMLRLTLPHAEALLDLHVPSAAGSQGTLMPARLHTVVAALRPSLEPLAQTLRLTYRMANLSLVLDSVRMPMVLLDASSRIQAINQAARSLFTAGPRKSDGQIRVTLPDLPGEKLDALVKQACGLRGPPAGGMLRLPGPAQSAAKDGGSHVLVLPVPRGAQARQAALVLVCGNIQREDAEDAPSIALLQHSYGLTPAEARLAQLILEGKSPGHVALRLRVSVATVRSHLSSVLRKTGASKQSDLIRRLSPLLMVNHGANAH